MISIIYFHIFLLFLQKYYIFSLFLSDDCKIIYNYITSSNTKFLYDVIQLKTQTIKYFYGNIYEIKKIIRFLKKHHNSYLAKLNFILAQYDEYNYSVFHITDKYIVYDNNITIECVKYNEDHSVVFEPFI